MRRVSEGQMTTTVPGAPGVESAHWDESSGLPKFDNPSTPFAVPARRINEVANSPDAPRVPNSAPGEYMVLHGTTPAHRLSRLRIGVSGSELAVKPRSAVRRACAPRE